LAAVSRARVLEIALIVALGALAVALRVPNYQVIPAFTDETEDIYRAFLAAQGKLLPLTDTMLYIGSLWSWLMALAMRASDFSLFAPRTAVLSMGVLTVLAAYALGRAWSGPFGGLMSGALLATAAGHIAVNSHVAWSNCITPLFTTLAVLAMSLKHERGDAGTRLRRGAWDALSASPRPRIAASRDWGPGLAACGLFWGLAVQTHPSVLALLPGAAIFLLWKNPSLFKSRWLFAAGGLFVLSNLNLIAYNLMTGFRSLSFAGEIAASYAPQERLTAAMYLVRMGRFAFGLFRGLGGAIDLRESDIDFLLDPALWPIALLALAGVIWQWRRGNPLPVLLLASAALVMPFLNGKYEPILNGRYLAPLLPVLFAAVGSLFAAILSFQGVWLARVLAGLVAVFVVLHPLHYLRTYYEQAPRLGPTNEPFFRTIDLIKANRQAGEVVVVDRELQDIVFGPGAGKIASAFRLALETNNIPYRIERVAAIDKMLDPAKRCQDQLVVLGSRRPIVNREIVTKLELRDLERGPATAHTRALRYGLYRLQRLPDAPDC
jgi:hypothetical protein